MTDPSPSPPPTEQEIQHFRTALHVVCDAMIDMAVARSSEPGKTIAPWKLPYHFLIQRAMQEAQEVEDAGNAQRFQEQIYDGDAAEAMAKKLLDPANWIKESNGEYRFRSPP